MVLKIAAGCKMECRIMGMIVGKVFENAIRKDMKDFKDMQGKYVHLVNKISLDFSKYQIKYNDKLPVKYN